MGKVRSAMGKLLCPAWPVMAVCMVLSAAGLSGVLRHGHIKSLSGVLACMLAAYTLMILLASGIKAALHVREALQSNALYQRIHGDAAYKAMMSLRLSLTVNLLYTLVKTVACVIYSSEWFGAMAFYYFMLSLERFLLLRSLNRSIEQREEWRKFTRCGALLLLLIQALAVMSILVIRTDSAPRYPGALIYVAAIYTVYALSSAIRNMFIYRKLNSPLLSASKAMCVVNACVSLFFLQTALLKKFSGNPQLQLRLNAVSGFSLLAVVSLIAFGMIIKGMKECRRLADT